MTDAPPTLTISIVNHGNRDDTLALLARLADLGHRPEVEVVVLDNASEDGSAAAIGAAHPAVRLIAQGYRAGFGANHNTVLGETDTDYVLLLNDDAMIGTEDVERLRDYMEANPQVAAAGPRIVSPSGASLQTAWARLGPARAALFALSAGQVGWVQSDAEAARSVGRVSGCALMLRRAALPEAPVFDEGYFMYGEDSDLCARLRDGGHEVHFVPDALVTHRGRRSSATVPVRRRVEQSRSTHRYLAKHYGPVAGAFTRGALALGCTEKALADVILRRILGRPVSGAMPGEFAAAARDALRAPAGPGLRELAEEYNERRGRPARDPDAARALAGSAQPEGGNQPNQKHPRALWPDDNGEVGRIKAEYARRIRELPDDRYRPTSPGPLFVRQAAERAVVRALSSTAMLPLAPHRVLEIGCGDGDWLLAFEAWGAGREHLAGIDLLEERVKRARGRLSGPRAADLRVGDAARLPWPDGSFDIVFQSMMLSSIADTRMRRDVAGEAARVLAASGCVISYDFWVDNPRNPRVRSVRRRELVRLFPGFEVTMRRAVIAPPVARGLTPISWTATALIQATTLLNAQSVAILRRELPRV